MSTSTHTRPAGEIASNQFGDFAVKAATEPQTRYIARLLVQRATPALGQDLVAMHAAGTLNYKGASELIEILLATPFAGTAATTVRLASDKQVAVIEKNVAIRVGGTEQVQVVLSVAGVERVQDLPVKTASALIDVLFGLPYRPRATHDAAIESGMYLVAGTVYKVYKGQSGRMLAKTLTIEDGEGKFEYAGLASRFVTAADRMSLEQAKQFGAIYGVCCKCGATLTDETSIAAGIGPVCGKRWA